MGKLIVVVGGQFGSEGKGAIAGWLSQQRDGHPFMGVRVAGPNAGHTVYGTGPNGEQGYAWRLRTVPVNVVTNPGSDCLIAAGSEIDLQVLYQELHDLDEAGYQASHRVKIDQSATLLEQHHHDTEEVQNFQGRMGSTNKGIGAARMDRLARTADLYGGDVHAAPRIRAHLAAGGTVVIEGTQGYGLGLHAGHYPFCTSQDCRAIDFLGQAGISPWDAAVSSFEVIVVARTFPIRVAGNSGPLKGETTWEELGLEAELTTVTKKVRRVGAFDAGLLRSAVIANGGSPTAVIALTMFDQVFPDIAGRSGKIDLSPAQFEYVRMVEESSGTKVALIGTSPTTVAWFR